MNWRLIEDVPGDPPGHVRLCRYEPRTQTYGIYPMIPQGPDDGISAVVAEASAQPILVALTKKRAIEAP